MNLQSLLDKGIWVNALGVLPMPIAKLGYNFGCYES
jgi:hypothetical protein